VSTWLPQPPEWGHFAVAAQRRESGSMLELYRTAIHLRRASTDLRHGSFEWLEAPAGMLAFKRGDRVGCVVNLSREPAALPRHRGIILSSGDLEDGRLPSDTTVWLELT
jgi:alpha-glucosidase